VTDLVVVSLEAWDDIWRRNQYLVAGLMRAEPGRRVLFVEPAVDTTHALLHEHRLRRGRGLRPGPEVAGADAGRLHLHEPTKPWPRRLDPGYADRWTTGVLEAVRRVGLTDPLLWVNDTMGAELLDRVAWPTLYDITDDWLAADRPPAEHARLVRQEGRLLASATTVVACSPRLVETKGADRPVELVPNGVDLAAYTRPAPRPADLPRGPVALYAGTIHPDRIDVELVERTAEALAGTGRVVLLGPVLVGADDERRLERAGVVLLGPRPANAVPAYLVHADLLLVPHVVTAFTESLDPIKRYEYAAARRPVVSTAVPGFTHGNAVVAERQSFPDAVLWALREPPEPPNLADAVDWSDRVGDLARILTLTRELGRSTQ
jgi:glycosyltransferase involved in cell wall biosynthesis